MADLRERLAEFLTGENIAVLRENISALSEQVNQQFNNEELFQERVAELELALEDVNWTRLMLNFGQEFSRAGLQKIIELARMMYLKNPLINRAVSVKALYVWGQGISTLKAKDARLNAVLQAFWDDPDNIHELTGHSARMYKEVDLEVEGNLFFVFFINPSSGAVKMRSVPTDEIAEIISDPEDAKSPWFYKRMWTEQSVNTTTGRTNVKHRTAFYPDWRYDPTTKPQKFGNIEVLWDTPIYHERTGAFSTWKFGVPEVYAAIDWARAYKEFLEDWASLTRSYSRFAWKMTTKGGAKGVASLKQKMATTAADGSGMSVETNPPPVTGATAIMGQDVDLTPMQLRGANVSALDGAQMKLMIAAGTGLPETYFGDVSRGSLATAKTMDRPTELMMRERQIFWSDILGNIIKFVLMQSVKAPSGDLHNFGTLNGDGTVRWNQDVDAHLDIDFPPVLERDVQTAVQAVVTALTLNGQQFALLDEPTATRLVLKALGEDDVDEIMSSIYKGQTTSVTDGQPAVGEARVTAAARKIVEAILQAKKDGNLDQLLGGESE
ncbi:MAG: hypothetical protein HYX49_08910 [Chloroflexi bacterium]|nr:hypothetical protein [Chloroflexota bacterium]